LRWNLARRLMGERMALPVEFAHPPDADVTVLDREQLELIRGEAPSAMATVAVLNA